MEFPESLDEIHMIELAGLLDTDTEFTELLVEIVMELYHCLTL